MAKRKPGTVEDYLASLDHPLKTLVLSIRQEIVAALPTLTEHIKWNAPSFCDRGEDRITFNLHKNDAVVLVFHTGAQGKDTHDQGAFLNDESGLLVWVADRRGLVTITGPDDWAEKRPRLGPLVRRWVEATAQPGGALRGGAP